MFDLNLRPSASKIMLSRPIFVILTLLTFIPSMAQQLADTQERDLLRQTEVMFEYSGTLSSGDYAPLWLTSNRYGLASVEPQSLYERARAARDIHYDDGRKWRLGYGLDLALTFGHTHHLVLEQAYVEGAWKNLRLTVGARQQPLEMQNQELSSGAMTFGINARPIPQVRLDIDTLPFPGTRKWWLWNLRCSYGWKTDGGWQQEWVAPGTRYTSGTLYHEKSLHWIFGRPDVFPLTYEIGLNMAAEFGGISYNISTSRAEGSTFEHTSDLMAYWNALVCRGSDTTDGSDPNVEGNHVGSWVMQLKYHGARWQSRAYWERFFEDHSMLTVQYGIRDMLIGAEVTLPRNPLLSSFVIEHLISTDQTGPIFHDPTPQLPERVAGVDDYYNNLNYGGWQNYGLTLGNPLLTSPLYNNAFGRAHSLRFYNNRVRAWHLGIAGDPSEEWHWRFLLSATRNWGTYEQPFTDRLRQTHLMAEATYRPQWAPGWTASLGLGLDQGDLIGNSVGGQITFSRRLSLKDD